MIARFPDHKALVFAYSDLLAQGVPSSAMRAVFDQLPDAELSGQPRLAVFLRLRFWWRAGRVDARCEASHRRSLPGRRRRGGLLHINAPGREEDMVGVINHHLGTLLPASAFHRKAFAETLPMPKPE